MVNDLQNNLILHEGFDYQENGELPLFTITDNDGDEETFFYGTSNFDYLGIFDGDGDGGADFNGNPTNGFNTYTGFDDNYLVASDIDGSSSTFAPPVFLTWSDLNVNGLSNLIFSADLATEDSDEALDFDDFVIFEYRVDGGDWQPLLAFETADDSSFNQNTFLEDTDFDGIGDGTSLTSSAQTFVENLSVNGTNLDLRLQIRLEAGREDIGIDNISLAPLIGSSLEIFATDAEKLEGDRGITEYIFTIIRSGDTTGEVSVDYEFDYVDSGVIFPSGTVTFADGETSKIITLPVTGDTDVETDIPFTVTLFNATNNATISVNSANGVVINDDFNLVKIHEIQGDGEVSPFVGQQFAIEAIVTGDFQGNDFLRGFYVQEEDTDIDDNPFTSEGIFVFDNNFGVDVNVGDKVYITGEVSEFFGETQFEPLSIQITGTGEIAPTEVMLPVATVINADGRYIADLEAYEGMLVNFPDTLTISEMFNLDRFGEFRAIQGDRAFQFTQINEPDVNNFDAHLQDVASRTITIDDGTTVQNPNPIVYPDGNLDTADSFRMGDAVNNLTGVVRFSRGSGASGDETFRIMPTENPEFEQVNPRPETPEDVGGRLKVASFNPLNFFTTIDDGQTDTAVGQSPRGADDLTRFGGNPPASDNPNAEFERQLDKLLTTLVQLDADIIGLQELENYFGSDSEPPIATLVNALNEHLGADIYAYVDPGMDFLGTDAIAVGAIYRQDTVRIAPNTTVAYLDDTIVAQLGDLGLSGEPLFTGEATSRVPLAVTFEEIATGETFTVTVNHFKSKGSSGLNDPNNPNFDQLDGQGFWNFRRTETAIALNAWLRTNPTGSNDQDVLILGDLNAYAQEDPIKTLENNYINLIKDKIGDSAYSYVFDGQLGTLDYALASPRLAQQVTGVTEWQINADEADALDYNLDFGRDADIFDGSVPYRTSDHDPLIVGLNLDDNLRVATFNASLNRNSAEELIEDLSTPDDAQAQKVAEIIQRANPDIILLNEFDYDANGDAIRLFQENYLGVSQNGVNPVEYPYVYFAPSNTGIASGFDLDNNGTVGGAGDAFGFGNYEGQYGMVLLSKYPIMEDGVRTFQEFLWKDMPNNLLTNDPTVDDPNTEVNENLNGYYSPEEIEILRLSSKSHWDVPVNVNGKIVHILAAHPTPPVFDGTEDRNGKRNFDEIRFWSDYVNPTTSDYIYDDQGNTGGLIAGERFVIVGDYNADPFDGDSFPDVNASDEVKANYTQAINQLLNNPIIQGSATDESITPVSEGGVDASIRQNGANNSHIGNPAFDTADFGFNFNDPNSDIPPGNLRVDYVLPSYNLEIVNAEVFWKPSDDPLFDLAEFPTSDHRLVYADLSIPQVMAESQNRQVVSEIEFLGEVTFATGTEFNGTVIGGLSGIVYDPKNGVYYSISDDRTSPRFYDLTIDLSDGSLDDGDITFTDVTTLLDKNGQPFAPLSLDPEGIALTGNDNLYISSEGDANALIAPFVNEFNLSGLQMGELPIDDKFLPAADQSSGIRNNLSFESATITPDGRYLYTATENALYQDGTQATVEDTSYSRIIKYDLVTKQVVAEYVYEVEPVAETPIPEDGFQTNGLVELLALDNNGTLLALERSFSAGVGNTVKLYQVLTQGALNVQGFNDLFREDEFEDDGEIFPPDRFDIDPFVIKQELLDFADLGITPDNLEGIALGDVLPDGSQSLIVVSDNNFSDTQVTQFVALGLDIQTLPAVLPVVETPQTIDDEDFVSEDEETVLLGDSDDPAVWIDKQNPNNSIIVATLKDGGLISFNLDGTIIEEILPAPFGDIRYNNVDVLYDFNLNGEMVDLAVASDRENDTLGIFKIDGETRQLLNVNSPDIVETIFGVDDGEATAYGLGGYKSPITGNYYVFVTQADGNQIAQLELNPDGNGLVTADVVRIIDLPVAEGDDPSDYQSEAIVVDQERGIVYVGVEGILGIVKFNAEPFAGNNVAIVRPTGSPELVPDLEGLGIYYGADGTGYLMASSQGDSSYALYSRNGNNEYLGSFIIADNNELGIDQANETDGLDIVNVPLGDEFPFGLLIVQDGANDPQNVVENDDELENNSTNFKLVPWESVANAFDPVLDIDTESFDPMNITTTLPNGVASGDVTQDSAVLWARSTVRGDLTLELATDLSFANILNTITLEVTDTSLPVKVQIDNLEDNTEYFYRAIAPDGTVTGGRFVTASQLGEFNGLSFGVTGDWRGELSPYPAISNVAELELDFFVQHGDTIYADYGSDAVLNPDGTRKEQVETLEEYRAKHAEVYDTRLGQNYWAEVRSSTSILATIDDHEVINDFAGGELASSDDRFPETEGLINDTQLYENGLQAFQEYNPLRDEFYGNVGDERFDGERKLYRSETYGSDAAVMVIDTRSFRDEALPTPDFNNPEEIQNTLIASLTLDRTLLGETQLEDLKQDLLDAEANGVTWKFVMIPEPIQNILPGITVDSYEGYGKERTELLKFIQKNNIQNVVFVAADVHSTYVNNLTYQEITPDGIQQVPVPVFEITTGSVAFDQPTGEILAQIVLQQDPTLAPFYNSLPIAPDADDIINDKDDFVKSALNQQTLAPFGFDPLGLNNNLPSADGLIDAELLQGDYYVGHTFGWTQFDIDADTQQLLITTYGIEAYSEEELLANPDEVLSRQPFIVSQFAVNPNNDAIALDDTVTTDEDSLININNLLDNDSDIDGDNLVIQSINATNTIGLVTLNDDGTVTYNPNGEFESLTQGQTETTTFEYTITDNRGGIDTAIVTVTIEGVNDNPIAVDDELITDEDTPDAIALLTNDIDVDGDDLTITEVTDGENGTVTNNNDGTVTYTPNADFNGEDSFTYTISDGNGGTDTATVNMTVNPVNDENINFDDEDRELNLGDDNYTITGGNGNNIITTGNGNNVINLGNGNNQVTTGDGDDNITTGSGSDRINPGNGNNIVNAGAGDDVIIGSGQSAVNNQIDGGEGNDTVIYDGAFADFPISVENGVVTVGTNTDTLTNVEQLQFSDRTVAVENLMTDNLIDTSIYRFRTGVGTYIYVENEERQRILQGGFNFVEEGEAFKVAMEEGENLEPIYRFRNNDLGGAYLYVGEEERQSIRQNFTNFIEEGLAFYTYGATAQEADDIFRFQTQPGGYIFVGEAERQRILNNGFNFTEEGIAFEALA